jgi:hypothetical protein
LNIDASLIGARIKYFNSIMVETGNTIGLTPGSVEVRCNNLLDEIDLLSFRQSGAIE